MPSPTFTERRVYRNAAVLQAFQSVQGTPVSDFSGAASRAMWVRTLDFSTGTRKGDDQGTTGTARKRAEARYLVERKPTVRLLGGATPKNIEWLLRSWGGSWSGGGTLTLGLTENINEFSTLALVEQVPVPNAQKLVRVWDGWAHKVTLRMESGLSTLDAEAEFACRDWDRTLLNALGPIVLPASFAPPAIDVFAPHSFRLYRDPAGVNASIAVRELEITLESGLLHEVWNDENPQVVKEGYTSIRARVRGVWTDETYAIEDDAETLTPTFRRFRAEWASGAKAFVIDMRNVDFVPSNSGWEGNEFREFTVEGEAYLDASGNYVSFELTP